MAFRYWITVQDQQEYPTESTEALARWKAEGRVRDDMRVRDSHTGWCGTLGELLGAASPGNLWQPALEGGLGSSSTGIELDLPAVDPVPRPRVPAPAPLPYAARPPLEPVLQEDDLGTDTTEPVAGILLMAKGALGLGLLFFQGASTFSIAGSISALVLGFLLFRRDDWVLNVVLLRCALGLIVGLVMIPARAMGLGWAGILVSVADVLYYGGMIWLVRGRGTSRKAFFRAAGSVAAVLLVYFLGSLVPMSSAPRPLARPRPGPTPRSEPAAATPDEAAPKSNPAETP